MAKGCGEIVSTFGLFGEFGVVLFLNVFCIAVEFSGLGTKCETRRGENIKIVRYLRNDIQQVEITGV